MPIVCCFASLWPDPHLNCVCCIVVQPDPCSTAQTRRLLDTDWRFFVYAASLVAGSTRRGLWTQHRVSLFEALDGLASLEKTHLGYRLDQQAACKVVRVDFARLKDGLSRLSFLCKGACGCGYRIFC